MRYPHTPCCSIMDYVSHTWWKCRVCGRWWQLILAVMLSFIAATASAQTAAEKAWDRVSLASTITSMALDTISTFRCPDKWRCAGNQATRELATWGAAVLVKRATHSPRPCAPADCGSDDPFANMPSLHTAFSSNWQMVANQGSCRASLPLAVNLPWPVLTAIGRNRARKHTIGAVVAGAAFGTGISAASSWLWCRQ